MSIFPSHRFQVRCNDGHNSLGDGLQMIVDIAPLCSVGDFVGKDYILQTISYQDEEI
jgi:hypothetical protein